MLFKPTLPFTALVLASTAGACLNDRDTLAQEARSDLSVVRIATGRFERNPPLYYRMRLDRLIREIPSQPDNLELYDDAGVAADRIGLGDQAVEWMARKRRQMESLAAKRRPVDKEAWYRYHANLGTFLIHRWMQEGGKPSRMAEAQRARDEIATALRIKPNAHFGRERAQLAVMDWLIAVRKSPKRHAALLDYVIPNEASRRFSDRESNLDVDRAIKGLMGLVALGNAWESFDIFAATNSLLRARSDHALARLAELRAEELAKAGKKSLDPLIGDKVDLHLADWALVGDLDGQTETDVKRQYRELRREADEWHAKRTAYMLARLKAGRHPDTDPSFWREYRESPPPSLGSKAETFSQRAAQAMKGPLGALVLVVGLSVLILLLFDRHRKRAQARRQAG